MGAKQAVGITHRREIAAAADPDAEHDRLAADYAAGNVSAAIAAREGFVDELVTPGETRRRLSGALAALSGAGEYGNGPGNIPL
jgi:acetyl-CoA carboxylase carboxyltransferase component